MTPRAFIPVWLVFLISLCPLLAKVASSVPEEDAQESVVTTESKPVPYQPSELVLARTSVRPDELRDRTFDLVVVGGTPAGVAMAVRAAREGVSVLLVNHTKYLGGMLANGLSLWDFQYRGKRAPIFDELRENIVSYYRTTYGDISPQLKLARSSRGRFEPKVAEYLIDQLVTAETGVSVLRSWIPVEVEREGTLIQSVTLREFAGQNTVRIKAKIFADATYEGDLFALAKVPYRVGRESREEFGEPHAGRIFTKMVPANLDKDSIVGRLNLLKYQKTQQVIPGGTGEGDRAIQAYNFRVTLSNDPGNRIIPEKPENYDARSYVRIKERWNVKGGSLPNGKADWNAPILIEGNWDYPEADWTTRAWITAKHRDYALGLLWFLQNDPSFSEEKRREAREWGLARDEFTDNGNMPYEMYVREARRLTGRHVFTEHDATLAPDLARAPICADSISITDWPLDSHECRLERVPGSVGDGKVLMTETTVPGQISYRNLLPQGLDNLLVPMCLSATHIGWGAIRLEPTVMSVGEAAGHAAILSLRQGIAPALLDTDLLVLTLAKNRVMTSFFNDVDPGSKDAWNHAVQYLGTRGFFNTYNANPSQPLTTAVGGQWARIVAKLVNGDKDFNPTNEAKLLPGDDDVSPQLTSSAFVELLKGHNIEGDLLAQLPASAQRMDGVLSRGDACQLMFAVLQSRNK